MDEPHLRGKSAKALLSRLRGGASTEAGNATLAAYSLASFIYAYIVVLMVTFTVTHFLMLEVRIGGASIIVGVVLAVYLTVRAVKRINFISTAYNRSVQFDRWRKRALIPSEAEAPEAAPETTGGRFWYFAKRALPLSLLILLFLPYPYEAGGSFEVYPVDRQVLTTDIAGIIEEVNYDGGEKVKKGDVIARISATDLKAQIAVLDAQIAEQKSIIADLKARPKPEEIILSQRELEVTQKRSQFSSDRVPRYTQLYQDRAISFEELEAARKERDVDLRDIATREAALALVKTGTPPDIIAAAIAKLKALTEERGLLDGKAVRTVLKAPFDGNILTLHLKQRLNSVLDKGQPFATIDSIGTFTAEIEVPESEISFVKLGAEVRARPNAFYNRTFPGKVQTVDGKVTTKSFGNVVKVVAVFDDAAGEVKTGMTGYAKVGSGSIPVWKAFSLALVRFFSVQVWSWIP
jgi:putative peptide zinc metalloprotease protein